MKCRIVFVLLLVGLAFWLGRSRATTSTETETGSGREDIRQTFQLSPGARVEVRGINGPVEIETADTDTAEVHIIRTANDKSELERQRIVVEQSATSLVVRTENSNAGWWGRLWSGGVSSVRQQVMLKIPRQSEVRVRGINGPVEVGEVEGAVGVSGVNGRVEIAQATGHSEITGINGGVAVGLAELNAEDGVRVNGINGNVEFRLRGEVNADVRVSGLTGNVSVDAPDVIVQEQLKHSRMRARIGRGGASLSISGINGNLIFQSAAAN